MNYYVLFGWFGAVLTIATIAMRTMVPLRLFGIGSNLTYLAYGLIFASYPTVVQSAILLPVNIYRLREMLNLIKRVKAASQGDLSMDWLKPFMTARPIKAGEILFRKGDVADHMYFVVTGRLHLKEIDIDVMPGKMVGELGMLAPSRARTQTLECTESGSLLQIGYDKVEELYYQNPEFGFFFLRLSSARLFENIGRLERVLAERDQEIIQLKAAAAH